MASTSRPSNFDRTQTPLQTGNGMVNPRMSTKPVAPKHETERETPQSARLSGFEPTKPRSASSQEARPLAASVRPTEAMPFREQAHRSTPASTPPLRPIRPAPRTLEIQPEPPRSNSSRSSNNLYTSETEIRQDLNLRSEWNTQRRTPVDPLAQDLEPEIQPVNRRSEPRSQFNATPIGNRPVSPRNQRDSAAEPSSRPEGAQGRHKKGHCQVCGEPLNFFAKICGIKLCKKHYF